MRRRPGAPPCRAGHPKSDSVVLQSNGKLELVALEYFKRDADGSLVTADDRPFLFGQAFQGPMPGHNPTMPVHYDLHVWLYEDNPSGTFAQFNPAVSCSP